MKFGKHLQKRQLDIPEYAASFVNYKGLKKVIKQLPAGTQPPAPRDLNITKNNYELGNPSCVAVEANKVAFFFRLDREIEKVNAFYLQKQEELKLRLRTLLDKKRVFLSRTDTVSRTSTTFVTLLEGVQLFTNDLNKLQQFVELNATGFSKILKKWDKTAKSRTKELYLSRAVDVQPCFNRDVISELSDQATTSLIELEAWAEGEKITFTRDVVMSSQSKVTATDVEADADFLNTVNAGNAAVLQDAIEAMRTNPHAPERLTRAFLAAIPEASDDCLNVLLSSSLLNMSAQDEINMRNCLHEAAVAGRMLVVSAALKNDIDSSIPDVYGRLPIHYASINGFVQIVEALLRACPRVIDVVDHDNLTPLIHSINHSRMDCVQTLIHFGARINPRDEQDYIPLNVACQHGFKDIAELILQQNAKILSDAEGLFPQHLIAQKGHDADLLLLLKAYGADMNEVDRLNQWTTLFYAGSEGNVNLLKLLLENGARVDVLDEEGLSAMYYAAWEGHMDCMHLLYAAGTGAGVQASKSSSNVLQSTSPFSSVNRMNIDADGIPDLSLPPPILPLRRYGHNFLDKKTLVQLVFKQLGPEMSLFYQDGKYPASRLMISSGSSEIISRNVHLPLGDDARTVSFQVDSLDNFNIDFEIFPTFGTQVIAKTAALSRTFQIESSAGQCVLPLFDSRVRSIGQLEFDFQIVKPFQGVPLEVTSFATYWKATSQLDSRPLVTGSSLSGSYVRLHIQLTRDLVPVVFPAWTVSFASLDIAICSLTYDEFEMIGKQCGMIEVNAVSQKLRSSLSLEETYALLNTSFLSLRDILDTLLPDIHLDLHILYPSEVQKRVHNLSAVCETNMYADTILKTGFDHSRRVRDHGMQPQRNLMFSTNNMRICTALNWKQPNYPVFFCSDIGGNEGVDRSFENLSFIKAHSIDMMQTQAISLKDAVHFAKSNNLMGIICSAQLLDIVPALAENIKAEGLVLVSRGSKSNPPSNGVKGLTNPAFDGVLLSEGVLCFNESIDM